MKKILLPILLATVAVSVTAHAQTSYPDEYVLRPLLMPTGMFQLRVPVVFNISDGADGKPVNIPFEIRLGLTDQLELRIFHPVAGLCISGKPGCAKVYNDLAVGMLYRVMRERDMEFAVLGALEVTSFTSPAKLRLDAGVAFKYIQPRFSIATSGYLGVGLNHRSDNGDAIFIPFEFAYQITPAFAIFGETGLYGSTKNFANDWTMPLGVGINYLVRHAIDLGAEFKLNNAIGNGSSGSRIFLVYAAWRSQ
jgi:hypothetical protein